MRGYPKKGERHCIHTEIVHIETVKECFNLYYEEKVKRGGKYIPSAAT